MSTFFLFVTWFVLCIVVGHVAAERGRSCGNFFFLSFLLSPLVGYAVLVGLPIQSLPVPTPAIERFRRTTEKTGRGKVAIWPIFVVVAVVISIPIIALVSQPRPTPSSATIAKTPYAACMAAMKLQGAGPFITIDAARDYAVKHPDCLDSALPYSELPAIAPYDEKTCIHKYVNLFAGMRGITVNVWNIKELDEEARELCAFERAKGLR